MPTSYVIEDEENPGELILDCAYEIEPNEKGIVLRWLLNGTSIYQWIPEQVPLPRTFVSTTLIAFVPHSSIDFVWLAIFDFVPSLLCCIFYAHTHIN